MDQGEATEFTLKSYFEDITSFRSYVDQANNITLPKVPSFDIYYDFLELNLIMVEI